MSRLTKVTIGLIVFAVFASVASFSGGLLLGHSLGDNGFIPPIPSAGGSSIDKAVDEVTAIVRREALRPSSDTSMTAGAISGILESLDDPYAAYFDPKHFEYFNEQSAGHFFGIGVTIAEKDGKVFVVEVIKDTPAQRAGLKPGDQFVTIGSITKKRWALEEAVSRVRGPEGTKVKLIMRRKGKDLTFQIERAKITVPNLMSEMKGKDVGYLRLMSFNQTSDEDLRNAMSKLEKQGAKGFILDLRDNPGGLLDASVRVASLFVQDGVIVKVDSRSGPEESYRTTGNVATDKPLVILVNENSASASEIVSGAMQDYKRAVLVGVKTFGKGSVQSVERLSTGGGIKLTTAHYLTPKGRSIDKKGLVPDVVVKMNVEAQADVKTDIQLAKALEVVRQQIAR